MKVKIKSWNAMATWLWDIQDQDSCTICQQTFEQPCPRCKTPGDECIPIEGKCKHYFHLHCIIKWTEQQQNNNSDTCPLCREKWVVKE